MRKMVRPKPVFALYLFLVVLVTDVIVDAKASTLVTLSVAFVVVTALGILAAAIVELGRPYQTPVCPDCGAPITEGADMALENGFDDVIDRMTPPDPPCARRH